MGKTSATVKNRYASKTYDRIVVLVPKGKKAIITAYAKSHGESVNGYINRLVDMDMSGIGKCIPNNKTPQNG